MFFRLEDTNNATDSTKFISEVPTNYMMPVPQSTIFCFTFPYRCKYYFKKQPDINITINLILISYFCSTEIGRILYSCDVAVKDSLLDGTDTLTGQHRGC